MTQLYLIGAVLVVTSISTGLLHRRSFSLWVTTCAALAVASSSLHLYLIRAPIADYEFWLGVILGYIIPIFVTFGLTRRLPAATARPKVGLVAFVLYVVVFFLSVSVGRRLGALYT